MSISCGMLNSLDQRVGILGGGQLARMLIESAHRMGIKVFVLDPDPCCPASHVLPSGQCVKGSFNDPCDVKKFISELKITVVTFDTEHVTVAPLFNLENVRICPHPGTLEIIQDKLLQKRHLNSFGIPVACFGGPFSSHEQAEEFAAGEYPIVLKSRFNSYDGRGNALVKARDELAGAFERLMQLSAAEEAIYAEKFVPFQFELAVIVVRDDSGETRAYPVAETVHSDDAICCGVLAPANVGWDMSHRASEIACKTVAAFQGAGVFGVELFALEDGRVLVNEVAPRAHNSGHYTIDACVTSQFENWLRSICGMPIGDTKLVVPAAGMLNVLCAANLEATFLPCKRALSVSGAHLHFYGKTKTRKNRKMAHINFIAESLENVIQNINKCSDGIKWRHNAAKYPVVGIVMGSTSDLPVMKAAAEVLSEMDVSHEVTVVSAHRTPAWLAEYASAARKRGLKIIIAGAGGAAHLPGMLAAQTSLPIIGVPVALRHLDGIDSLYSILQMPRGVPVATVAIDNSANAALLAVRILGTKDCTYHDKIEKYHEKMRSSVLETVEKIQISGWKQFLK